MPRRARLMIAAMPLALLLRGPAAAQDASDVHAPWDAFLSEYVVTADGMNRVRYGAVTEADHAALKGYIDALETLTPSAMGPDERLAYYFNLYNAAIVDVALDNYPLESIRSVGGRILPPRGPWKMDVVTVEGEALSFDDIEHERVRSAYDEPRVHYAFNCASIGCPDIASKAWRAETLDADLDAAARAFVAHPRGVSVDEGEGEIDASSIYKWFREDFGGSERGVLEHVARYATGSKLAAINAAIESGEGIDDYDYDWDLNAAP